MVVKSKKRARSAAPASERKVYCSAVAVANAATTALAIVGSATHPRKISQMKIDLGIGGAWTVAQIGVFWAVVIVKDGYSPNAIGYPGTLYEPSQDVVLQGQLNYSSIQDQKSARVTRYLGPGDQVYLLTYGAGAAGNALPFTFHYRTSN